MKVNKLVIKNFKRFQDISIEMNNDVNIFVGENDSGKTTVLEALTMALTGKLNGVSIPLRLNLNWFNNDIRNEYKELISSGQTPEPPSIEIEVYLSPSDNDSATIERYRGTNNSLREDIAGVKLEISFDTQYDETYKELLSVKKITDIPIEYYKVNFRSFAVPELYTQFTSRKVACIDTTKKDYGSVLSRFVSNSISEYLNDADITELRRAYRANRSEFTKTDAVMLLNDKLKTQDFNGKAVSINLRESGIDEWKNDMTISLGGIPLENSGFGTQNMLKSEFFLDQNTAVDILIIEEPENNLSYANMSVLISRLSEKKEKQLFISTHSSFVANKLGLQHLLLVSNGEIIPFKSLNEETFNYFLKLPGYNTLRVLLANRVILVEGPADELIVQRAYIDKYGKQPIEDGIDVVSIGGLAFLRYCELASLIRKPLTIVTDNDGDVDSVKNRYNIFQDIVRLCIESDNNLNTLEPAVLEANTASFESFKSIIYKGKDVITRDKNDIKNFMLLNKTIWSMRVFISEQKISYPGYILEAIGSKAD